MASISPFVIELTAEERDELERRAREYTGRYCRVMRAKIVLMAAAGVANSDIAARLDTSPQVVCRWRKRFFEGRLEGLEDLPRSGRPPVFSPSVVIEAKQLACELPVTTGVPLSRWSCAELARELIGRGVVASISAATIWRILTGDAIRPWFHRSWIAPRDPDFAAKPAVVLDLYGRVFDGEPLGDKDFSVCADEKTSMWAVIAGCALLASVLFLSLGKGIASCVVQPAGLYQIVCISGDGSTVHLYDSIGNHLVLPAIDRP